MHARILSVAVFLAELSTVARVLPVAWLTKYQLTHVCIFVIACFPRQRMDSLQEIYIQDLPTGSPVCERGIPTFAHPLLGY